jgi:hypothetical protein
MISQSKLPHKSVLRLNIEGLAIGIIVTLIINILVSIFLIPADVEVTLYTALSVIAFGISVGWTVHISDIGLHPVLKGIVLYLILGISWRFEIYGNQGQPGFFVSAGIEAISGALMGILSMYFNKSSQIKA